MEGKVLPMPDNLYNLLSDIIWYKQAGYLMKRNNLNIFIDPWDVDDKYPADVIFITHAHFDHFSMDDIDKIKTTKTKIVAPKDIAKELSGDVLAVEPDNRYEINGIKFTTVYAYNNVESRITNHPRSNNWVGYLLDLDGNTYYHAGDTDHVPELDNRLLF